MDLGQIKVTMKSLDRDRASLDQNHRNSLFHFQCWLDLVESAPVAQSVWPITRQWGVSKAGPGMDQVGGGVKSQEGQSV